MECLGRCQERGHEEMGARRNEFFLFGNEEWRDERRTGW